MVRRLSIAIVGLLLAAAFSTVTFAHDKQEMAKDTTKEMTKSEKAMGPLKSLSCDPSCGFMVRSHDEKEAMSMMKSHAKKVHKMDMTDKQMKEMMKTEGSGEMHK